MINKIGSFCRKHFISGLLVTVPIIVTFIVLRFLFSLLDGFLDPVVQRLLGYRIPGLGLVVTLIVIVLAGLISRNYFGARLYRLGDRALARMPLVRVIYTAAKQLVQAMATPRTRAFSEVALIEYPRKGVFAIGFLSGRLNVTAGANREMTRIVFVPSTPTPFSGFTVFVPESDIYPADVSVEEALKLLVSGGVLAPDEIRIAGNKQEELDATCKPVG